MSKRVQRRDHISISPEENFLPVFNQFNVFFYNEIRNRGWGYLIHELPEESHIDFLVRQFYDGIKNIDFLNGRILIEWNNVMRVVNLEMISGITGIPMTSGMNNTPLAIDEYIPWMGRNCVKRDGGGIKTSSVYRNVYAVGRWLKANVLGSMHVSSFYREELHIIHVLMTRNHNFCMVRKLFDVLCSVKGDRMRHPNLLLPLPCLVTAITSQWRSQEDFEEDMMHAIILKAPTISNSYTSCLQIDWVPSEEVEDVPMQEIRESSTSTSTGTGESHFEKEIPSDVKEAIGFLHKGQKLIFKMVNKLLKKKKKKNTGGESEAPPPERPTRTQPLRRNMSERREESSSRAPSRPSYSEQYEWGGSHSQHW
jgi:hypothetical protein